jgi:NDP-sugar pyrophosphorylase family protein
VIETSLIHKSATFKDVSCEISRSVIGSNVTIGTKVKIQNSVVLNDVVIQDYEHVIDCLRVPNQIQESEEDSRSANISKQKGQSVMK